MSQPAIRLFCMVGGHEVAEDVSARLVRATKRAEGWEPEPRALASIWVCADHDTGIWADAPDSDRHLSA